MDDREPLRAVEAERDQLRKLFDDAGQGEYNVLALVDHYQRGAMECDAAKRALNEACDELETLKNDIKDHLPPYVLDDGTDTEANPREVIEYAGEEIRRLTRERDDRLVALERVAAAARDMVTVCGYPCGNLALCGNCKALADALDALDPRLSI